MLWVDLLLVAGAAVAVALAASALGGRAVGARLEKRRREKQGEKNAEEERRRLVERCAACDGVIDPDVDLFEREQWWHRRCWRESVDDVNP